MKNWFIVQSHSNFENKVSGLIKEEADKAKISDKFEEIIVPTHDVTEVKRGKRIQRKKKYFPGYVLVCLLYTSPSPRDQRGSRMPSSA